MNLHEELGLKDPSKDFPSIKEIQKMMESGDYETRAEIFETLGYITVKVENERMSNNQAKYRKMFMKYVFDQPGLKGKRMFSKAAKEAREARFTSAFNFAIPLIAKVEEVEVKEEVPTGEVKAENTISLPVSKVEDAPFSFMN